MDDELGLARRHELDVVRQFMEWLEPGMAVFDIGANIGLFTIVALRNVDAELHAFEPDPNPVWRVYENYHLNGCSGSLFVRQIAVWDSNGRIDFAIKESSQSNFIAGVEQAPGHQTWNGETVEVEAVRLDTYCREYSVSPDLIKLDVEGGGANAIYGAEEVLEVARPRWLVEIHSEEERSAFEHAFSEFDYDVEAIGDIQGEEDHWGADPHG